MHKALFALILLVLGIASPAIACPPYARDCYYAHDAHKGVEEIRRQNCITDCTGAFLVYGNTIYKVADRTSRTTVTPAKAEKLLKRDGYLVFETSPERQRTELAYLVAAK